MSKYTAKDIERFWSNVDKRSSSECWNWLAGINEGGYGCIYIKSRPQTAHRMSWELTNGAIPNGLYVLHKCDNRRCCNPSHLFLGTHLENMQDMVNKKRNPKGERNGRHKLTKEQVATIKKRYAKGDISTRKLGREFGISCSNVFRIVHNISWRDD